MNIIDGKQIAQKLRNDIAKKVEKLDRAPGLAVILVGDDPASTIYVRNKDNACKEVGFYSEKINKSANITQQELLDEVIRLNNDDKIEVKISSPANHQINDQKFAKKAVINLEAMDSA